MQKVKGGYRVRATGGFGRLFGPTLTEHGSPAAASWASLRRLCPQRRNPRARSRTSGAAVGRRVSLPTASLPVTLSSGRERRDPETSGGNSPQIGTPPHGYYWNVQPTLKG